ncbi:hypothetical protein B0H19DRAFT_1059628 [Mycena capillaripes]|nr:hypothetical protein B0H19DRAFT_1059628 [Mycena capillaripes]
MRFSTFVLFASTFASSLAAPALQTTAAPQPQTTASVDSLVSQSSVVLMHLTRLNAIGARIAANSSTSAPEINAAIYHINRVVAKLVPVQSDGLLDGLLGRLLGGGCGLGEILSGNGGILSGLLSGDLIGGLLGSDGLLGGLIEGLLRNVLGGDGGLLGGLLGGGDGGLLSSITGLLNLFPGLDVSCGTDLVGELLEVVQSLVGTLTGILPDAQQCACGENRVLKANVASLIKANKDQLAPIRIH